MVEVIIFFVGAMVALVGMLLHLTMAPWGYIGIGAGAWCSSAFTFFGTRASGPLIQRCLRWCTTISGCGWKGFGAAAQGQLSGADGAARSLRVYCGLRLSCGRSS